ncbi:hypothetical protein FNV43_RR01619 [Rhamnella rubrinervis]|uniref:Uncharacterized protein n=1 Tax=Rhamnella rubrinervis TaxID=2594499 RepID=A0A8K0HRT9_9ROSA|nr:hypothetical protein FNV43_RR01619 [Rhamnella rubrinervis]
MRKAVARGLSAQNFVCGLRLSEETGGNQLLGGSISLSPYTQVRTSDLPRRYRCGPHGSFLGPRFGHSSPSLGPGSMLSLEPYRKIKVDSVATSEDPPVGFLAPYGFTSVDFAHMSDSLVRVSRRANRNRGPREALSAEPPAAALRQPRSRRQRLHGHDYSRAWAPPNPHRSAPESIVGPALTVPHPGGARPHSLPSRQFQALFDSLFKVLFIFPRGTCLLSVSPVFSLGPEFTPDWGCIPKQPDFASSACVCGEVERGGALTSGAPFRGLGRSVRGFLRLQLSGEASILNWLFGCSPLLGESFSRSSSITSEISVRVVLTSENLTGAGATIYGRRGNADRSSSLARFAGVSLSWRGSGGSEHRPAKPVACPPGVWVGPRPVVFLGSAVRYCVRGFNNDPSARFTYGNLIRLLLPLNDKVRWTSCGVAGEPPASAQSEHFTDHSIGRAAAVCTKGGGVVSG